MRRLQSCFKDNLMHGEHPQSPKQLVKIQPVVILL